MSAVQCESTTARSGRCSRSAAWLFEIRYPNGDTLNCALCGIHAKAQEDHGKLVRKIAMPDGSPLPAKYDPGTVVKVLDVPHAVLRRSPSWDVERAKLYFEPVEPGAGPFVEAWIADQGLVDREGRWRLIVEFTPSEPDPSSE